jgi:hypothetical protein
VISLVGLKKQLRNADRMARDRRMVKAGVIDSQWTFILLLLPSRSNWATMR